MTRLLKRALTLFKRAWRIYVAPPKETKVFLDYRQMPIISACIAKVATAAQPKQAVVNHEKKLAYVSCMKGHALQEFSFAGGALAMTNEWAFPEQCVECELWGRFVLVTTTNFKRGKDQSSHLWVFDPQVGKVVSKVDTQGEWSKVIVVDDARRLAFVSNWHSNDVSVIDLSDLSSPRVIQRVPCDESPRGMVLMPDGHVVATSFYGKGIFAIEKKKGGYEVSKKSAPFDPDGYSGNMRDVLLGPDSRTLFVSNLGRNLVHWYESETLELKGSLSIPRNPNSMRVMRSGSNLIGVSCRKDNLVFFFDSETKKPVGISSRTEKLPTGLAAVDDGFLVTNFDSSSIELHKFSR